MLVTGTDTGVGKTWVTARLARLVSQRGLRVAALKAVESGCSVGPTGGLIGEDDNALVEAAGGWQQEADRCQFRFAAPLAPGVAAQAAGAEIDLARIAVQVARLRQIADLVLVEGAGGWCVPFGRGRSTVDLARAVAADVIVVGRAGLGTINHSVLTARAVAADGLVLRGLVLSRRPEDPIANTLRNADEIRAATGAHVVLSDELTASAL